MLNAQQNLALSLASRPLCWVVTDGKTGTENQCIGLALALGYQPVVKRIKLRLPWLWLTPYVKAFEKYAFSRKGDPIKAPYPQLMIASGRRSLPAVFAARRAMGKDIVIVQLQDPHCDPKWFDLIAAPQHDQLTGDNVVSMLGAPHKVTPEVIEAAVRQQASRFSHLPAPHAALLLGGANAIYSFDESQMNRLLDQLDSLLDSWPGSLLITPSRRTGERNIELLKARFGTHPRVWIWDWEGENPYFALLGLGDFILVTADSVSMTSEAASTGKPIYVIPLEGGSPKFDRFHRGFAEAGITRPFTGTLETWHYPPLHETESLAMRVRQIMKERFGNVGNKEN